MEGLARLARLSAEACAHTVVNVEWVSHGVLHTVARKSALKHTHMHAKQTHSCINNVGRVTTRTHTHTHEYGASEYT